MVVRRPVECLQRERGVPLNHLRNLGSSGLLGLHSLAVIFGAGLVTSLSPCTLNVFPLTLGYTGAFSSGKSKTEVIGNSISFATGLATTLALLGVAASFAGKAYDQIGRGLPVRSLGGVQAYLAGLTFVLAEDASPAVLQCLLRCLGMSRLHQGSTGRGSLLLTYTTGYVARLLLAASFAGSLQPAFILQVLSMDQSNEMIGLIKPTSGSAYVEGLDIWTEMNRIYTSMGVCPQHDFPWGILTGREHLLFYGRLKNLKGSSSVQTNKRGNIAEA